MNRQKKAEGKNVLIIQANPARESFCASLAQSYAQGAEAAGAKIKLLHLSDLNFNPDLGPGTRRKEPPQEPDLLSAQKDLQEADHLVFVYPIWWGAPPALLKGFIDRTFLPGIVYKNHKGQMLPEQLFKGKTARLIVTMDAPVIWYAAKHRSCGTLAMKSETLQYIGVNPVKVTEIGMVRWMDKKKISRHLAMAEYHGARDLRI